MDMRDKSSDVARVGILKCDALFRFTSACSVSRGYMLEDTEEEGEGEEDARGGEKKRGSKMRQMRRT